MIREQAAKLNKVTYERMIRLFVYNEIRFVMLK